MLLSFALGIETVSFFAFGAFYVGKKDIVDSPTHCVFFMRRNDALKKTQWGMPKFINSLAYFGRKVLLISKFTKKNKIRWKMN